MQYQHQLQNNNNEFLKQKQQQQQASPKKRGSHSILKQKKHYRSLLAMPSDEEAINSIEQQCNSVSPQKDKIRDSADSPRKSRMGKRNRTDKGYNNCKIQKFVSEKQINFQNEIPEQLNMTRNKEGAENQKFKESQMTFRQINNQSSQILPPPPQGLQIPRQKLDENGNYINNSSNNQQKQPSLLMIQNLNSDINNSMQIQQVKSNYDLQSSFLPQGGNACVAIPNGSLFQNEDTFVPKIGSSLNYIYEGESPTKKSGSGLNPLGYGNTHSIQSPDISFNLVDDYEKESFRKVGSHSEKPQIEGSYRQHTFKNYQKHHTMKKIEGYMEKSCNILQKQKIKKQVLPLCEAQASQHNLSKSFIQTGTITEFAKFKQEIPSKEYSENFQVLNDKIDVILNEIKKGICDKDNSKQQQKDNNMSMKALISQIHHQKQYSFNAHDHEQNNEQENFFQIPDFERGCIFKIYFPSQNYTMVLQKYQTRSSHEQVKFTSVEQIKQKKIEQFKQKIQQNQQIITNRAPSQIYYQSLINVKLASKQQ